MKLVQAYHTVDKCFGEVFRIFGQGCNMLKIVKTILRLISRGKSKRQRVFIFCFVLFTCSFYFVTGILRQVYA